MAADDSHFPLAASIANPAYILRELEYEANRQAIHETSYRPGVAYSGLAADPYVPRTDAELIARAVAQETRQAAYNASHVGRANAAAKEAEDLLNHLAGVLSAYRAAVSRGENTVTETAFSRATEAATVTDTLVDTVGRLYAAARLARTPHNQGAAQ